MRFVRNLDRKRRVTVLPFQQPDVPKSYGLTVAQCENAAWAITQNGQKFRGAAAINMTLAVILGTKLPLRLYEIAGVRQLQDGVYDIIVRIRSHLPGDTPFCEQFPERCR